MEFVYLKFWLLIYRYTSIGSIHNTWPNPSLAYKDEYGQIAFRPAWLLKDPTEERSGRGTNKHNKGQVLTVQNLDNSNCIGEIKSNIWLTCT